MSGLNVDQLPPACLSPRTHRNLRLRNVRPKSKYGQPDAIKAYVGQRQDVSLQQPQLFIEKLEEIENNIGTWGALVFGLLAASGDDIVSGFDNFFMLTDKLKQDAKDNDLFSRPQLFDHLSSVLSWKKLYKYDQYKFGAGIFRMRNYFIFDKTLKTPIGNCIIDAALIATLMLYGGHQVGEGRNSRYLHSSVYLLDPQYEDYCLWTVNNKGVNFGERQFDPDDLFSGPLSFIATLIVFKYYHKFMATLENKGQFAKVLKELEVAEALNPFMYRLYLLKREIYGGLGDTVKMEEMAQALNAIGQYRVEPKLARAALARGRTAPLLAALLDKTGELEKFPLIDQP